MKVNRLKRYLSFIESIQLDSNIERIIDITESLSVIDDHLLSSISAEEEDIHKTFDFLVKDSESIEAISKDIDFLRSISKFGYKISDVDNTDDYETFIDRTIKFSLIRKKESNDLNNPDYILIQAWNETTSKWEDVRLYKVNDDINKFYNKLTSKTVEFTIGDKNYIYKTSNSGNNWDLQNSENEDSEFKKNLDKQEIKDLAKRKNLKITII